MNQDCENKVLQNMEEGIPKKVVRENQEGKKSIDNTSTGEKATHIVDSSTHVLILNTSTVRLSQKPPKRECHDMNY